MILLDTNVLIYAFTPGSPYCAWAKAVIASAVTSEGAALNAVSLVEICVGDADPGTVADRIRSWGVDILDIPAAAAEICAAAYRRYRIRRLARSETPAPTLALPDFFIGAHAQLMRWELATADQGRFRTYFPSVALRLPA